MNWGIITDSSSDLLKNSVGFDGVGFEVAPLKIITDKREFTDDESLDIDEQIEAMKKSSKSSSACPSVDDFKAAMEKYDASVCVTITSALSGTYNAACLARDMVLEEHPDKKIAVIDSKSATGDIELTVKKAYQLIKQGLPFEKVAEECEKYCRRRRIVFSLACYDNLIKNGRMNHAAGLVATALGIRAVSVFNDKGEIALEKKSRGERKAICAMLEIIEKNGGADGREVIVTHCKNPDMAHRLTDAIRERWSVSDIKVKESRGLVTYYAMPGGVIVSY